MYLYTRITDLLKDLNIVADATQWNYQFRTNYINLHTSIMEYTNHLGKSSFTEKLFCYTNSITARPQCKQCEANVTYAIMKKTYHTYCSQRCALSDMETLIGVKNVSHLASTTAKRKQTYMKNHGVDHPSKTVAERKRRSVRQKAYWDTVYATRTFTSENLSREQYGHRAQQYANTQYNRHIDAIDAERIRGMENHLDHIFSITDGFVNDVPINIISDISNLRIISATENIVKNKSSHKTLTELYEDHKG